MIRRNFSTAGDFSSTSSSLSRQAAAEPPCYAAEDADEAKARRWVNTVATLRIIVPVALITAIVMSGRLPQPPIDTAMAATVEVPAVTTVASQSYFPAQYVNQGAGGEEHVSNF